MAPPIPSFSKLGFCAIFEYFSWLMFHIQNLAGIWKLLETICFAWEGQHHGSPYFVKSGGTPQTPTSPSPPTDFVRGAISNFSQ